MKRVIFILTVALAGCKAAQTPLPEYTQEPTKDKWEIERELEEHSNFKY